MKSKNASLARTKDVVFALAASDELDHPIGRLALQKVIYLADILSGVWAKLARPGGFSPYKNGPYDSRIQNSVDALAFRGIVSVSTPTFRQLTNVECQYSLTDTGKSFVKQLVSKPDLKDELELFREIAREISRRGWVNIKDLVYAEPTYDLARSMGNSSRLPTNNPTKNLSHCYLKSLEKALSSPDGTVVTRENLVQIFFEILEVQARMDRDIIK